ncbi:MAG: hypothetical protein KDH94_01605 [Coxiellaceae bacterium]|nr:hypothetical protein [Coxiellaceae bacterium]
MRRIHPLFPTPQEVDENANREDFLSDHLLMMARIPNLAVDFPVLFWNVLKPNAPSGFHPRSYWETEEQTTQRVHRTIEMLRTAIRAQNPRVIMLQEVDVEIENKLLGYSHVICAGNEVPNRNGLEKGYYVYKNAEGQWHVLVIHDPEQADLDETINLSEKMASRTDMQGLFNQLLMPEHPNTQLRLEFGTAIIDFISTQTNQAYWPQDSVFPGWKIKTTTFGSTMLYREDQGVQAIAGSYAQGDGRGKVYYTRQNGKEQYMQSMQSLSFKVGEKHVRINNVHTLYQPTPQLHEEFYESVLTTPTVTVDGQAQKIDVNFFAGDTNTRDVSDYIQDEFPVATGAIPLSMAVKNGGESNEQHSDFPDTAYYCDPNDDQGIQQADYRPLDPATGQVFEYQLGDQPLAPSTKQYRQVLCLSAQRKADKVYDDMNVLELTEHLQEVLDDPDILVRHAAKDNNQRGIAIKLSSAKSPCYDAIYAFAKANSEAEISAYLNDAAYEFAEKTVPMITVPRYLLAELVRHLESEDVLSQNGSDTQASEIANLESQFTQRAMTVRIRKENNHSLQFVFKAGYLLPQEWGVFFKQPGIVVSHEERVMVVRKGDDEGPGTAQVTTVSMSEDQAQQLLAAHSFAVKIQPNDRYIAHWLYTRPALADSVEKYASACSHFFEVGKDNKSKPIAAEAVTEELIDNREYFAKAAVMAIREQIYAMLRSDQPSALGLFGGVTVHIPKEHSTQKNPVEEEKTASNGQQQMLELIEHYEALASHGVNDWSSCLLSLSAIAEERWRITPKMVGRATTVENFYSVLYHLINGRGGNIYSVEAQGAEIKSLTQTLHLNAMTTEIARWMDPVEKTPHQADPNAEYHAVQAIRKALLTLQPQAQGIPELLQSTSYYLGKRTYTHEKEKLIAYKNPTDGAKRMLDRIAEADVQGDWEQCYNDLVSIAQDKVDSKNDRRSEDVTKLYDAIAAGKNNDVTETFGYY